jgi:hypothetical protein
MYFFLNWWSYNFIFILIIIRLIIFLLIWFLFNRINILIKLTFFKWIFIITIYIIIILIIFIDIIYWHINILIIVNTLNHLIIFKLFKLNISLWNSIYFIIWLILIKLFSNRLSYSNRLRKIHFIMRIWKIKCFLVRI